MTVTEALSPPDYLCRTAAKVQDALRALPGIPEPDDDLRGKHPADVSHSMGIKPSGTVTLLSLYAVMVAFTLRGHGLERIWELHIGLFTFDLPRILAVGDTLIALLTTIAASLAIELPIMILIGMMLKWMYGESKSHSVLQAFSGIQRHYMKMTLLVVAEELVARGLFLGLPFLLTGGNLSMGWIWTLFLLGNLFWAAIHIFNFKDKRERKWLKVLPQFAGGFPLTVIFLNFGLVGSILCHLAFNNLVMSSYRKGTFNHDEIAVIIWRGIVLAGSLWALVIMSGKSVFDLSYWFYEGSFTIPGWAWTDYLFAVLAITSALTIIGDLILLDVLPEKVDVMKQFGYNSVTIMSSFGIFAVLNAYGVDIGVQVLCMALAFLLVRRSGSVSGMTRVFWIGLPSLMAVVCACLALGPESFAWLIVLLATAVELPDRYFRYRNAHNDGFTVV